MYRMIHTTVQMYSSAHVQYMQCQINSQDKVTRIKCVFLDIFFELSKSFMAWLEVRYIKHHLLHERFAEKFIPQCLGQ